MRIERVENPYEDESLAASLNDWGWFGRQQCFWWVAYGDDGKWVGYAGLCVYDRDALYMGPAWVETPYRGQGLQTTFIKERIEFARAWGAKRLVTVTERDNEVSRRNILKAGFREIEAWAGSYGHCYQMDL